MTPESSYLASNPTNIRIRIQRVIIIIISLDISIKLLDTVKDFPFVQLFLY